MTEIRRHRDAADPSREHAWLGRYQAALYDGRGHDAVALLQEHDAIRLHDTRAEAMVAMVEDWNKWRHDHPVDQTLLLVHGRNDDVDTVNLLAQSRRREAGEIGARSVRAPDRDYELHVGDLIVLRGAPLRLSNGGRIENGTTMRITAIDERHDRITVSYARACAREASTTIDLAPLRRNQARLPALRLAYAMHPNPAQGATVARTATISAPTAPTPTDSSAMRKPSRALDHLPPASDTPSGQRAPSHTSARRHGGRFSAANDDDNCGVEQRALFHSDPLDVNKAVDPLAAFARDSNGSSPGALFTESAPSCNTMLPTCRLGDLVARSRRPRRPLPHAAERLPSLHPSAPPA